MTGKKKIGTKPQRGKKEKKRIEKKKGGGRKKN